jgi:hypothetical protein
MTLHFVKDRSLGNAMRNVSSGRDQNRLMPSRCERRKRSAGFDLEREIESANRGAHLREKRLRIRGVGPHFSLALRLRRNVDERTRERERLFERNVAARAEAPRSNTPEPRMSDRFSEIALTKKLIGALARELTQRIAVEDERRESLANGPNVMCRVHPLRRSNPTQLERPLEPRALVSCVHGRCCAEKTQVMSVRCDDEIGTHDVLGITWLEDKPKTPQNR